MYRTRSDTEDITTIVRRDRIYIDEINWAKKYSLLRLKNFSGEMSREKDAMIGPLWWIIFLTGIFSVKYGGGFSVALVFCWGIIGMYWIPERGKTNNILGGREYDAGLLGDARNPLFLQGHVRKDYRYTGRRFSLAGLKGIYYTQVHAIFQMIVFGIYGIICAISGFKRYEDLEMIFFLWGVFGIIVFEIFV